MRDAVAGSSPAGVTYNPPIAGVVSLITLIGKDKGDFNEGNEFKPLFRLSQFGGTPGVLDALIEAKQKPVDLLLRHVTGDWGDLEDEDKRENDLSVKEGFRILSANNLDIGVKVWVITEWDRSVTTILLPEEY